MATESQHIDWNARLKALDKSIDLPVVNPGSPGLGDLSVRWDMGRAGTAQEQEAAFKKEYPEGDLSYKMFPDSTEAELGYRKTPSESWAKVDAPFFQSIMNPKELLGDVTEFAGGDLYEIGGEILAAGRTKGASLGPLAARIGLGNLAGSLGGEVEQYAKGIQTETLPEQASRIATKTALSTGFGTGAEFLIRKSQNLVGRGSFLKNSPEGEIADEAAMSLGLSGIPVPFVTSHPWLQKIAQQSRALLPNIDEAVRARRTETRQLLESLQSTTGGNSIDTLRKLEVGYRNNILRTLEESMGVSGTKVADVGEGIKANIDEYDKLSQAKVSTLYDVARNYDEPIFDLAPLKNAAKKLLAKDKGALRTADQARTTQLLDSSGTPFSVRETVDLGPTSKESLDPQLRGVINEIVETQAIASRNVNGVVINPVDQLEQWASRIGHLTQPGSDQISRLNQSTASQLYGALRNTLDNVTNLNQTPGFAEAWKEARKAAADRFDVLSKVATARNNLDPVTYLRQAYGTQAYGKLKNLKMAVPINRWANIKNGYIQYLIEPKQINNLSTALREMPQEISSLMFSQRERAALKNFGGQIDKLNNLKVTDALAKQTRFTSLVREFTSTNSTANIAMLKQLIDEGGGLGSTTGRNIRAGMIEDLINKSIVDDLIDPSKLKSVLSKWKENGALDLMDPADVEILHKVAKIESLYADIADPGTSMAAASAASSLKNFNPAAIRHILTARLYSQFLISPYGKRLLSGTGGKRWELKPGIALAASAFAKFLQQEPIATPEMERFINEN